MANNKIKFLRGTSNEYTAAKKDNDTIYFTTDDGKLYVGDKEILGESIKTLNSHINDSVKHITSMERTNWNAAKAHADSAHAPSNAQANVIETIKVNGTALTPSSKAVDITVPSVGNGTITIKQAGTIKGTFTTNQNGNTTIELTDNNATYDVATSSTLGLVKSGTDITVDSSGNVSVNDDSHNHVISNVDGLQSALDGKAASSHTHTGGELQPVCIEFTPGSSAGHGGHIDFHFNSSTADYTSRIIESAYGNILINDVNIHGDTITGSLSGNASSATKATQDSTGQKIDTTYIKGLSASNGSITYTKGDNTTGTITTVKSIVITLSASGWNSNSQTISVSEVNANSIVFITPAPQSQDEYIVAYINCTNQDNGSLTFTCKYIPENDLQINLVIL